MALMSDEDALQKERLKNGASSIGKRSNQRYHSPKASNQYYDEDLELQKALELSKQSAQSESKQKIPSIDIENRGGNNEDDDDDLAKALVNI